MKYQVITENEHAKLPCLTYQKCPKCQDPNLYHFDSEVFCFECGWDSIEMHVEALISGHIYSTQKKIISEQTNPEDQTLITSNSTSEEKAS